MRRVLKLIMIFLVLILCLGVSYAVFSFAFFGDNNLLIKPEIELEFLEDDEVINITNAVPISDEQGINQSNVFEFQVRTKTKINLELWYNLNVEKLEVETGYSKLNDSEVKIYLTDYEDNPLVGPILVSDLDNYVLYSTYHVHDESNDEVINKYRLRIWIDGNVTGESWDMDTQISYSFKIGIEARDKINDFSSKKFSDVILANEAASLNVSEGLYQYGSKYYYSGENVNNYVDFNNEVWRVVSIEDDGAVKIVKDEVVSVSDISMYEQNIRFWGNYLSDHLKNQILNEGRVPFDIKGKRPIDISLVDSYCLSTSNGCNAYDVGNYFDLMVDGGCVLKEYLEDVYFSNMTLLAKEQVQNYILNIGIVETNKNISTVLNSEQTNVTNSFIGLLNVSDYVYASLDAACRNSFDKESCAISNWLLMPNYQYHLLNGKKVSGNAQIWTVSGTGKIASRDANNNFYLRPVVVLNKNITAFGTGKINNKYVLGNILD